MDHLVLTIPALYADHHVVKVRETLLPLAGIEDVIASAAFQEVAVDFNPERISEETIVGALTGAGYPPGPVALVERAPDHTADPAWTALSPRQVATNPLDRQMSGEFRKY